MSELDMEILKKREERKKEKHQTLEDGLYLDGSILSFTRKPILDIFSMRIPDVMKQMPTEYAKLKYPSEFRPQQILTTPDLRVNLGFTVFLQSIQSEERMELLQQIQAAIQRANPDVQINSCVSLQQVPGCYFTFRSHGMDRDLSNKILLVSVGEQLVQGSYQSIEQENSKWEPIVLKMWETIEALKKEE